MDYKISVITPVYNAEKYVQRAFDSLKAQTIGFEHIQVIMVDDCSADGSYELISGWKREYSNVTVMRADENSGSASVPRNIGLTAVKAPYVMFLDNDDFFEADACEKLYNEMLSSKADIVTGYYRNIDKDGNHLNERCANCAVSPSVDRIEYIFPQDYIKIREVEMIFWCKIYKADIIADNKLSFVPHSANEDIVFLAQYMLLCKKLVYINVLIYNCNARMESLSRSLTSKYMIDRAQAYSKILEIYTQAGKTDFFNTHYSNLAIINLRCIFESESINTHNEYKLVLSAWTAIVRYILNNCLRQEDEAFRELFASWADEDYDTVINTANEALMRDEICSQKQHIDSLIARNAQLAAQNEGQQQLIESLTQRNAQLAAQNDGQQASIESLRTENDKLSEKFCKAVENDEQMNADAVCLRYQHEELLLHAGALQKNLDDIHRSRLFKLAAKLSKNLNKL